MGVGLLFCIGLSCEAQARDLTSTRGAWCAGSPKAIGNVAVVETGATAARSNITSIEKIVDRRGTVVGWLYHTDAHARLEQANDAMSQEDVDAGLLDKYDGRLKRYNARVQPDLHVVPCNAVDMQTQPLPAVPPRPLVTADDRAIFALAAANLPPAHSKRMQRLNRISRLNVFGAYSVVDWVLTEAGGQTLFEKRQGAWTRLVGGGGAMDPQFLERYGVPPQLARKLEPIDWKGATPYPQPTRSPY